MDTSPKYYERVKKDFAELLSEYQFAELHLVPTAEPSPLFIKVIAVSADIIEAVNGRKEDFTGEYSKLLFVRMPPEYWRCGCEVYGCKWFNEKVFRQADVHLFHDDNNKLIENEYGFHLCVGTPASFKKMKNVILEAVRTADNMMVAYERVQSGVSDEIILNAYAHGELGKEEFKRDRSKYLPR